MRWDFASTALQGNGAKERSPRDPTAAAPFAKTTKYASLLALGFHLTATYPPDYTKDKLVQATQEAERDFRAKPFEVVHHVNGQAVLSDLILTFLKIPLGQSIFKYKQYLASDSAKDRWNW